MSGFESPNYTQTPNDLFDMVSDMGEAELKVTLCAIRRTFGFHRKSFRLSLTDMQEASGLSRQGVIDGAEAAESRGTLTRLTGNGVTEWVVNVVDQTGQRSRPPSNKERVKETKIGADAPNGKKPRPRNEMFDVLAEVCHLDPRVMGGRIGKTASKLIEYQPEAVRRWYSPGGWWYTVRCKGLDVIHPPSPEGIEKTIRLAAESDKPKVIVVR